MTMSDASADQDWGRLIDADEAEREAAMVQRYVALAALPEDERRQQLRAMATAEYALPDAQLRTFTRSRLRAWLGMDAEAARHVAASYDAVMREMPATVSGSACSTDVLVLDLTLPDGSGLDVLRQVASTDVSRPAVVAISAALPARQRRTEFAPVGLLPTPFPIGALLRAVECAA